MGEQPTWLERDAAVVWHGFTQMSTLASAEPIIVERAEGHYLVDTEGRRYFDAISSLWVNTLGHRVPELDDAIVSQLGRVAHSTLLGNGNTTVIELAEALARVVPVPDPHFLFASDGADAVEQAVKMAFQFWHNQGEPRRHFLAFGGAYHGDTVGSLSVGAGGFGTDLFDPLRFPVLRALSYDQDPTFGTACQLVETHREELAAVIVEPLVQGAAGMQVAPAESFKRLGESCREHGIPLIADEVATGFGRTGTLFACEQCSLAPDLLCLGKGLTGGYLPMSVTVASGRIFDAFAGSPERAFFHGHSYGGNALAAAVARRHLELLQEWQVLENVVARGAQLAAELERALETRPEVAAIRQRGLMCGIELRSGDEGATRARLVANACVRAGVLVRPLGPVVVLVPPLTVTSEEVSYLVDVVAASLAEVASR